MKWYALGAIKNYLLSQTYFNDQSRETAKQLFSNLFHIIDFEKVLVQEEKLLVNNFDFEKINNLFKYFISDYSFSHQVREIKLKPEAREEKNLNNCHIISNYTVNFSKNLDKKGFKTISNKAEILTRHVYNLRNINKAKRILSFDFEYSGTDIFAISEIGYTIYFPETGEKESCHIIIDGKVGKSKKKINLEQSFLFGETKNDNIVSIINDLHHEIKKADYIVGHDIINELKVLDIMPNWNKIIDTKFCDMTLNKRETYCSLEKVLRDYGVKPTFLHNAGNDARLTLEVALLMYEEVKQPKYSLLEKKLKRCI